MKKVLAKTLIFLGLILSVISFFFYISSIVEASKPDPIPENGQIVLNGLGEAILLVLSIIATIGSFIFYSIDNLINIFNSNLRNKIGKTLPLVIFGLIILDTVGYFFINNIQDIIIPIIYIIQLAIFVLEIIILIKYFKLSTQ